MQVVVSWRLQREQEEARALALARRGEGDAMSTYPNARDCEHGRQRGKCADCDVARLEAEADTLRAECAALRAVAEAAAAEVVTWSKGCDSCPHNHGIDCESAPGCLVMENLRSALAALPAKESKP